MQPLINALTTNRTEFFRERHPLRPFGRDRDPAVDQVGSRGPRAQAADLVGGLLVEFRNLLDRHDAA